MELLESQSMRTGWRRFKRPLTFAVALLWLLLAPPTTVGELVVGMLVLLLVHRIFGHRQSPRGHEARRRGRSCGIVVFVIMLIFQIGVPSAWAGLPEGDYCRNAPTPESTGSGVTGLLDPQASLTMDGTIYGDRGYAGLFWYAYDPGCAATTVGNVLGQTGVSVAGAFDGSGAGADTQIGNLLLKVAKLELAATTGMRARAMDLHFFDDLDSIMTAGIEALNTLLINPWLGLPLMIMGLILAMLARRGQAPESAHRLLVGLAGLGLIAFLGQYPLAAAGWADEKIVALQQGFDQGFLSRLPESMVPALRYCQYDYNQFTQDPVWDNGAQVISGTACTTQIIPTLDPANTSPAVVGDGKVKVYSPDYFTKNYYAEVMVENLIFPYWQQGLIGTSDRSGPNYDLARQFLAGQSLTKFQATADVYYQSAAAGSPPDTLWCTFVDNKQVCGRDQQGLVPGPIMTATEATYRQAIESAGEQRYPWIKGAGNRMSSGATAAAAVTAVAPLQFAAYTGVFAGRLVLRIFIFAGLIAALGLFIWPQILRRIGSTLGAAAATVLLLSVLGSLTTYLALQLTADPKLLGRTGLEGGLVILAITSILIWLAVKPMRRIGAMLSTAATGNPNALTNARRQATGRFRQMVHRPYRQAGLRRSLRRLGKASSRGGRPVGGPADTFPQNGGYDSAAAVDDPNWSDEERVSRPENGAARAATVNQDFAEQPGSRPENEPGMGRPTGSGAFISDEPRSDDRSPVTTFIPTGSRATSPVGARLGGSRGSGEQEAPTTVLPPIGWSPTSGDRSAATWTAQPREAARTDSGAWSVSSLDDVIYRPETVASHRSADSVAADDVDLQRRVWTPPPPRRPAQLPAASPRSETDDALV